MDNAELIQNISALESAIATGARKVKLGDKETEFRDLKEMYQVLNNLKRKAKITKKSRTINPVFDRGL